MSEVRNSSQIKFYHAINSKVQMKTIALGTNRRVVIEADIREFENEAVMAHDAGTNGYRFKDWIKDIEAHFSGEKYGLKLDFKESNACEICCQLILSRFKN